MEKVKVEMQREDYIKKKSHVNQNIQKEIMQEKKQERPRSGE